MKIVYILPLIFCTFVAGGALGLSQSSGSLVEFFSGQTFRGLTACVDSASSTSLSEEESRSLCASRHAVNLTQRISLQGQGAPVERDRGAIFFAGELTNTHADYLVTFVQISLFVFDDQGDESEYAALGNVWAAPFDETAIEFRLSPMPAAEILEIAWCDHEVEDDDRRSCKSWEVATVAGVPL